MAGLACAYELTRRQLPFVLVESSNRLGGVVRTVRTDGFVLDGGPDSFIVTKPWAMQLCRELGLESRLREVPASNRKTYILRDGKLQTLPEGLLGIPSGLGPLIRTPLFSWGGKLRMATEVARPVRRDEADESIADFVRRRLGRQAYERLLGPLLAGIHAGDPEYLSIRATFPRLVEMEQKHGSLIRAVMDLRAQQAKRPRNASPKERPSMFRTLAGGMQELVDALVAALPPSQLRLEREVKGLERTGSTWRVSLSGAEPIHAKFVVLAIPTYAAAALVNDLDPELAGLLREVRYVSTATLLLSFRRGDVPIDLNATGFLIPPGEKRRILACTWTSSKFDGRAPEGQVLLRVFFGGARDEAQASMPEEELVRIARKELGELMQIEAAPTHTQVFRYPKSNPQYEVGHLARMGRIREREARHPGLFLVGSGYEGVGIPDTIRQGRDVGARIEGEPIATP